VVRIVPVDPTLRQLIQAVIAQFSDAQTERVTEGDLVPGLVDSAFADPGADLPEVPACIIGISPSGVELAFVALSDPAAEIFLDWTEESSARKALERLDDFNLRVLDRRPENIAEQYSARRAKWVGVGRLSERVVIPLEEFDEQTRDRLVAELAKTDPRWERFGFALARTWPGGKIGDASSLAADIAAQLRPLLSIRGTITSRARRKKSAKPPAMERAPWRESG
jgi:hypothetical protein